MQIQKLLLPNLKKTFFRFPITIILCISFFVLCQIIVDYIEFDNIEPLFFSIFLGIFLFTNISLFTNTYNTSFRKSLIIHVLGFILILLYYFSYTPNFTVKETPRFLLTLASLIIFLPLSNIILDNNYHKKLWNNSLIILKNFCITVFFSGLFYLGIVSAIYVISELFNITIQTAYIRIFIFFSTLYAPFVFLSYFPTKKEIDKWIVDKFINILIKFIIFPLSILYLGILYIYIATLIFKWELPHGMLASFTIGYSIISIISNFLISKFKESKKIYNIYYKFSFIALFPLIIVLFISIVIRINQYGLTSNRLLIILFGVILLIISIINTIKKKNDYRICIIIFSILIILFSYGPWNYFNIGLYAQSKRLSNLINQHNLLFGNTNLSNKKYYEINDLFQYIKYRRGIDILNQYLKTDKFISTKEMEKLIYNSRQIDSNSIYNYFEYRANQNIELNISHYKKCIPFDSRFFLGIKENSNKDINYEITNDYSFEINNEYLVLIYNNKIIEKFYHNSFLDKNEVYISISNNAMIYFKSYNGHYNKITKEYLIDRMNGVLFLK